MKGILLVAGLLLAGGALAVPEASAVHLIHSSSCGPLRDVCEEACNLVDDLPYEAVAGVIECLP